MKRFIIFLLAAMVLSVGALEAKTMPSYKGRGYKDPKFNACIYGGYNVTGNTPVYGGIFAVEVLCLRADLDFGGTTLDHPLCNKHFPTFSPSFGLFIGEKHKFYVMGGLQTYAYVATTMVTNCTEDKFFTDRACAKLKIGYQCAVWKQLFVSLEASHLFKPHQLGYVYFPSSNIHIGVGWKF